ncbi:MAG: AAA family ATPase [Pseudomonadales bacterium]
MAGLKPLTTLDVSTSRKKTLLYGHHGWGKTTQMKFYQEHYGPGFIISGESGLSSIRSANIDFLPFTSWDGETDPEKGLYSFREIFRWTRSPDFAKKGYTWIGIDSLSELSDHCFKHHEAEAKAVAEKAGKKDHDGFAVWNNYTAAMLGACKAIRDMPLNVIVTALAKETQDANGDSAYWPMVSGKQLQTQLPGIFDFVFCGVRATVDTEAGQKVVRYIVTDEARGWHGKARDEGRRLKSIEKTGSVIELFQRLEMSDDEYSIKQEKAA